MHIRWFSIAIITIITLISSPLLSQPLKPGQFDNQSFGNYWYQGKAELTKYELEQARYGEIHRGEAVLIFVTENFLNDRQVKHEFGTSQNTTTVLKLNAYRHFFTGIYPYSLLTSTFAPVSHLLTPALKVSASTQEWCGHAYTQLNLRDSGYLVRGHSYFQREGDQEFNLESTLLEDQVWTQIRMNPAALKTGELLIVPALQHLRMVHKPVKGYAAEATLSLAERADLSEKVLHQYQLKYREIDRVLTIVFEAEFPYQILGWTEKMEHGAGSNKALITRANIDKSMISPYWQQNSVADSTARKALGL